MEAVSGGRRLVCADGGQNRQRTAAAFLHPPNHRVQPLSTDLATIPRPHTVTLGRDGNVRLVVGGDLYHFNCNDLVISLNRTIFVLKSRTFSAHKVINRSSWAFYNIGTDCNLTNVYFDSVIVSYTVETNIMR